jgi:hypothetical protein
MGKRPAKKSPKPSKAKSSAVKKAPPVAATKAPAKAASRKPAAANEPKRAATPSRTTAEPREAAGHYTPQEIQGIGWRPFRYPPE